MEFSNQIKEQRKKLGFTQEEIAEQLYVTRQTISNWEQGKSYPDLNMLVKISDIYKMPIDAMLKDDTHLQAYLEQGKAYNAFSVLRGLLFIMYGIFFLMSNYIDNGSSSIIAFCTLSFAIIFCIAIFYGELVKPFFLGITRKQYNQKGSGSLSLIGKICLIISILIIIAMLICRNDEDLNNYLETSLFIFVGLTNIFQKYMRKQE